VARRNALPADPPELDDDQAAALVFIDIPACGGAVLDPGLPLNRQRRSSRRGPDELFEGVGGIRPGDMEQLRRATKKLTPKGLRILRGPFPFAVSELLDRLAEKRDFHYLTFLREPVDRVVAHYLELQPRASFADALEAGFVQDNLQTRMLSGSHEPFGEVTEEMLDAAKRNLRERFLFVGLAERLEESLVLARIRLVVGAGVYRQEPNRVRAPADVPAETRALAREINRYDIELYDFAKELFDNAPELEQLEFQCEAAAIRASRGDGEIEVTTPVPAAFEGGEREWQMLVRARAECFRLEWELDEDRFGALVPVDASEADG
jgi:Galactose-3-O-sulfotransferase